uniref:SUEL-type lectin domain-containing protein n=1 Tax=Oryzias latipes TaxID=8090 RepID=A0A3B3HNJ1_ORYLA
CSSIFFMIRLVWCSCLLIPFWLCFPELGGVISVQTSLSGGEDSVACSEGGKAEEVSSTGCSDMALTSSDLGVSGDSRGTTKYLQTVYTCQPAGQSNFTVSNCGIGGYTYAIQGDYLSRQSISEVFRTKYNDLRFFWVQEEVINCHPGLDVTDAGVQCNGKNSCIIKAGNSEFGDPCVGTFNHLEVAYTCGGSA